MLRRAFRLTVRPFYVGVRGLAVRLMEQREGIRTAGEIPIEELGIDPQDRIHYQPSRWFTLDRILPVREVGEDDVFIDMGSGMGRVVYRAAARYPLARVIGVEQSERLHRIAEENLRRARGRLRSREVELVLADASEYELPDDVTIVYFSNPFTGRIFASVLEGVVRSLERRPRRLRIIYFNPVEERMLLDAGFQVTRRLRGMRPTRKWSQSNSTRMYERPVDAAAAQ
jgi:16S rRNA G966 N2-methylase RsmD